MGEGQRTTLELLIVFAVLVVFVSANGKGFWATLFQRNPWKIEPPRLEWPTISLPGGIMAGGGSIFPPRTPAAVTP